MADNKNTTKITIEDIANALNVSKTTVSRAISGKGRIGTDTRRRVLEYIKEYDYRPNSIAKSLAESKSYNICFVIPSDNAITESVFYQRCLCGINQVAVENDYDLIVSMVKGDDLSQLSRQIENGKVDGVILGRTSSFNTIEQFLRSKNVPFVTVGSSVDSSVIQVDNDHESACCDFTMKLLKMGIKDIALIGGDTTYIVNRNRYRGFVRAFENADMQLHDELIFISQNSKDDVEESVEVAMERGSKCIIAMDDDICIKVINKLLGDGKKIPEDIMVASFYNSYIIENSKVSVSAIDFDEVKLGNVAAKTLIDQINEEEPIKKVLLGYEIKIRESTRNKNI